MLTTDNKPTQMNQYLIHKKSFMEKFRLMPKYQVIYILISCCWAYDNDQSNVAKYGYLYNFETAKNVCPNGYHLPSDNEWEEFAEYINSADGIFTKNDDDWEDIGKIFKSNKWLERQWD